MARAIRSMQKGAARAVLSGQADARPKTGASAVEMIRHLKVARDTAVKSRTQAMITLKTIIVSAPAALREQLEGLAGKMALIRHLAALRPGALTSTTASAKAALRALARRWLTLDAEIQAHDAHLDALTAACTPALRTAYGISTGTAAEMLILVGGQPDRIRSEAAFAKLCGACPIPASSGKTIRHRLNRGGSRQANAALYRVVIVRMRSHPPTLAYVRRRTREGKTKLEELCTALSETGSAAQDSGPGDAAILRSLPGVGPVTLATLLTEAAGPLARRDDAALRTLSGVAPVTKRSGKTWVVVRRGLS